MNNMDGRDEYFKISDKLCKVLYKIDNYIFYTDYEMEEEGIRVLVSKYYYKDNVMYLDNICDNSEWEYVSNKWREYYG